MSPDVNCDRYVIDLLGLLSYFGDEEDGQWLDGDDCFSHDVNREGFVNVNDLLVLLSSFGEQHFDGDGIWEAHGLRLWESLVDRLIDRAKVPAAEIECCLLWELLATPQANIVRFRLRKKITQPFVMPFWNMARIIMSRRCNGVTWLRCTFQNPPAENEDSS